MPSASTLKQGFITGVILVAPLAVSLLVIEFVYTWLTAQLSPVLSFVYPGDPGVVVQLAAIVAVLGAITGLGLAARTSVVRYLTVEVDHLMEHVPGVRAIYSSVRQASNAVLGHGDQFERVALVEWPRQDVHTLGFVTSETPAEMTTYLDGPADGSDRYNVFVPMTPNPMGGFLAVLPESRLVMTDLSVSEGLELVLTTGLSGDDELAVQRDEPTE